MLNGIGFFLLMLTMIARGPAGSGDMLDLVPTDSYWQAKSVTPSLEQLQRDAGPDSPPENVDKLVKDLGSDDFTTRDSARKQLEQMGPAAGPALKPATESKDPEVAAAAGAILKTYSEKTQERAIRRLMAIRTLGEVPQKDSAAFLKKLADSKEPFVADYAARSIAKLEGTPLPLANHRKEVIGDLQLLPKETGIVAQGSDMVGMSLTLEVIADLVAEQGKNNPGMMRFMAPNEAPMDKAKIMGLLTPMTLKFLEQAGNMRVDGVTLGIAENVGPNTGWVALTFRGKYNAKAFVEGIKADAAAEAQDQPGALNISREGNVDVVQMGGGERVTFLLPSNEQLIVVLAPPVGGRGRPAVVDSLLAALKTGKGEFDQNQDLAALIKTVDPMTANLWAAGKLNAEMQKEPIFGAIDSFTLVAKQGKENLTFTLTGTGSDADKIKAAADQWTDGTKSVVTEVQGQAEKTKGLDPLVAMLQSIKIAADGKSATMTGEITPAIVHSVIAEGDLAYLLYRETHKNQNVRPGMRGVAPVPPVQDDP